MSERSLSGMHVSRNPVFLPILCLLLMAQTLYAYSPDALYGNGSRDTAWQDPALPGNGFPQNGDPLAGNRQQAEWDRPLSRGFAATLGHGAIACGISLASHGVLMLFNGFVTRVEWAFPTSYSIPRNLTTPWKWEDKDGFLVNHLGHPTQGALYVSAARANGFGFYGSLFFAAFGSVTWEVFGESQHASINDFYTTVPGGMVFGEILYRLFLQAHAAGVPAPLTFLLNPAAGFNRLVARWDPPHVENNIYDFRAYIGGGYARTVYSILGASVEGGRREMFSSRGPFADVGVRVIYGDPFVQDTRVPFRHFEFIASFGTDAVNQKDFRIFSGGNLFSFSPLYGERRAISTGLSLHFDFVSLGRFGGYDGAIDMYNTALSWSLNQRRIITPSDIWSRLAWLPDVYWGTRSHAGFVFFGASKFFSQETWDEWERDLTNFGYGISIKHFSTVELGRRNRFDVNTSYYFMWSYPGTSILSRGFVHWRFSDFTFSHLVSQRMSLGATFSRANERGFFPGEFPNTRKTHWSIRTFVIWNGNNIRTVGSC
ncbi:MAG: DUF3943 domain-containing protein [Treponema sp.]|nr:DUF3943 domain-containing protein [Treponema sp.]